MAAYTATNWTVTAITRDKRPGDYKRNFCQCTLATGGEVPAAGVPLPKAAMGLTRYANSYILHNDVDLAYTTATAACIKWQINATATTVVAYAWKTATGAAANTGGRAIKKLATTVTLDVAHVLFISAVGY